MAGTGYPGVIAFRNDSDEVPTNVKGNSTAGGIYVLLHAWDIDTLSWVKQSSTGAKAYQRTMFYAYSSGRVKYKCKHVDIDANTTDADWDIWKYSDDDFPNDEGPRIGAVNTEAVINALSWNI